ncbi:hypothetical protein D9757_000884 [Collybiopsis confluens]|uniref:DUF7587 domain-containing protein n=1 Tax=Collybiopsis confluens TaxID=2823264 RepID=A0A8H5I032_9AGAR|nr:hypothetical protein D9757_000884 [Collybiopsis confluens]
MAGSSLKSSYDEHRFLPQSGFGSDVTFSNIVTYHRYLFRIYTPKSLPSTQDDSVYFVGPRFDKTFAPRTPVSSEMYSFSSLTCGSLIETATYEDCIQHLGWETRSNSPFISTSFSLFWVIWDALRRYNIGVKHDVEIAIIDAGSLSGKAVTALQLLRKSPSQKKKDARHSRWLHFAQESQSVLVYGFIPRSAVLASVPLRVVIQNMPSYFLQSSSSIQIPRSLPDRPPDQKFAWDFTSKTGTSFQKFCQEASDCFTRLPYQTRVRETAIASVRLALAMLKSWFHDTVENGEIHSAVTKIRELSGLIAHWPEQQGSRDYAEMASLMKALIELLAEEVRGSNARTRQASSEQVQQLQTMVHRLLEVVRFRDSGATPLASSVQAKPDIPPSYPPSALRITIPTSTPSPSSSSCPSSASPATPQSDIFVSPSPNKSQIFFTPAYLPSPNFSDSSLRELSPPPSPLILADDDKDPSHLPPPPPPLHLSIPDVLSSPGILSATSPSFYYTALKSPSLEFSLGRLAQPISQSLQYLLTGRITLSRKMGKKSPQSRLLCKMLFLTPLLDF